MNTAKISFLKILWGYDSLIKEFTLIQLEGKTSTLFFSLPGRKHCVILLAEFPEGFFRFDEFVVVKEPWKIRLPKDISFIYTHKYYFFL